MTFRGEVDKQVPMTEKKRSQKTTCQLVAMQLTGYLFLIGFSVLLTSLRRLCAHSLKVIIYDVTDNHMTSFLRRCRYTGSQFSYEFRREFGRNPCGESDSASSKFGLLQRNTPLALGQHTGPPSAPRLARRRSTRRRRRPIRRKSHAERRNRTQRHIGAGKTRHDETVPLYGTRNRRRCLHLQGL